MSETLKTILCCTDFSPESEHAVEHAARLARSTNATLILAHLVHVASGELLSHDPHGPTNLTLPEARERALKQLEDLRTRLVGDYANVELVAKFGAPAESAMTLRQGARRRHHRHRRQRSPHPQGADRDPARQRHPVAHSARAVSGAGGAASRQLSRRTVTSWWARDTSPPNRMMPQAT